MPLEARSLMHCLSDAAVSRHLPSSRRRSVVGVDDGMPTWIADIVVEKPTAEEAIKYACELNDKFEQPIY